MGKRGKMGKGSPGRALLGALAMLTGCAASPELETLCNWSERGLDPPDREAVEAWEASGVRSELGTEPVAFMATAQNLAGRGLTEEAIAILDAGLARFRNDADLLEFRGDLLAGGGFHRAAERDYQRSLEIDPERARVWRNLGKIRLTLDLPASAHLALRQCDSLDPDDRETLLLLARAVAQSGQAESAWSYYERALEASTALPEELLEGVRFSVRARSWERDADRATTVHEWVNRARAIEPESACVHLVRGLLLDAEGKLENAAAAYAEALERNPASLAAATNLAVLRLRQGDGEGARAAAEAALKLESDSTRRQLLERIIADPATAGLMPGLVAAR